MPALLAVLGVLLYGYAAARYLSAVASQRPTLLVAVMAAFLLLAESLVAIAFARGWHLSWWEWHVLMLAAFALVAVGARRPGTRSGSRTCTSTTPWPGRARSASSSRTCRASRRTPRPPARGGTAMLNEYFAVAVRRSSRRTAATSTGSSGTR